MSISSYIAGVFRGPASNLKATKIGEEYYGIAVTAAAGLDGAIVNPQVAPKPHSSARLYNSLFVRHWDTYKESSNQTIFYCALLKSKEKDFTRAAVTKNSYFLSNPVNALKGSGLESPMPPFGGPDHFDISSQGLCFVAKDPKLNPALHTKTNIYLIRLNNYLETTPTIYTVEMGDFKGAMTSPVFSSDGGMVAFLAMKTDGYESDKNQLFIMPDIQRPSWLVHMLASADGKGRWDRSPDSVLWSDDGKSLYLTADDLSKKSMFALPADFMREDLPKVYDIPSSVADAKALINGRLFVSATSLVETSLFYCLEAECSDPSSVTLISQASPTGLSTSQISSIWFPSAGSAPSADNKVHALLMRPSSFDPTKKYPLAILVHGGPQGCWSNSWSTRWNAGLFAEQGYIVVCPNITGSTGYGQGFTDAIHRQWGGLPYLDLVSCFDYLESGHIPYVDTSRAVALGASYGGFMMNWIQGHALGRKFKALVCHDGVFSTNYELATDELYFVRRDFGGAWWSDDESAKQGWLKWDPSRHTQNWCTPQLVIHSELDYRLTMADGLAAFNVLQARDVPSQFLTFPDENHFILKPENSRVWHHTVINFINKYSGLAALPPTDGAGHGGGFVDESQNKIFEAERTSKVYVVRRGQPEG